MGRGNSGVEHAQFYRAERFREKSIPFKLIFTDRLPQLHQHMKEWHVAESEVIGIYDYLLSDDPDNYLREGEQHTHDYYEEVLWDTTSTQRIVKRQATGNYTETVQRRKQYLTEKNVYHIEDDRVILENGKRKVSWHYRQDGSRGRRATNIRVDNFRGKHYLFTTFEELLAFFFLELQRRFEDNAYMIDRGAENEEVLIRMKQQGAVLKIVAVVHAQHFVTWDGGHPLWNNYYQYLFANFNDVDLVIVATQLQRQALLSQLTTIGVANVSQKINVIPVGGVSAKVSPKIWDGTTAKFITASRLHPEKHISHIIQAVSQLRLKGMPATLTIYGAGGEENQLTEYIKSLNLEPFIQLKGLSQNMVQDMKAYDVFVSASYSEGFGLTYIEAISNAMPIATYANLYGAQELVHEGVNGHLAMFSHKKADEAANVKQLAEAMRHVFEHYNELSVGAVKVAKRFDNKTIADQWQKAMVKLL